MAYLTIVVFVHRMYPKVVLAMLTTCNSVEVFSADYALGAGATVNLAEDLTACSRKSTKR